MHRHLDIAPPRRVSPWLIILGILSLILLALLACVLYAYTLTAGTGAARSEFEVERGMTVGQIISALEKKKLIHNADLAALVFRYKRLGGNLHEGFYTLSGDQNLFDLADTLSKPGRPATVRVTFPEGRRVRDVASSFARAGFGDYASNLKLLRNSALSKFTSGKASLEGFLFPDTYEFRIKDSPQKIVQTQLERMNRELTAQNIARAGKLGLNVYQWVTLSSMVQAEAGSAKEMPQIAGVFFNRIQMGMRLQSDPTIAYGLGIGLPELDRSRGDFTRDTPFNTYTRAGLPPTPINNPGAAALEATLKPVRLLGGKPTLYFLHGTDGKLYLNTNFDDHLRDVNRFR